MKAPRLLPCPSEENLISERCYISELSNSDADPDLSIAQARVPPAVTTAWHSLAATNERYLILEGEGVVEVEGLQAATVRRGDVILIPAGCRQRITNNSDTTDLLFLALCTPPFRQENYREAVQG